MTAYRDQYASVFRDGQNVVLIALSPDAPDALQSWAYDLDFPGLFGSDPEARALRAFGGVTRPGGNSPTERTLFVIDPEGRIAHVDADFDEVDPMAYEELKAAIEKVTPAQGQN
ncbi:MAG: redoxin domain-containing protein [Gemmatimonadetes bacterium]|nr:redoxin domain-containing protein [Gemmatimonadota bacterium]